MKLEVTNFPDEILPKRILLLIEQTKENMKEEESITKIINIITQ